MPKMVNFLRVSENLLRSKSVTREIIFKRGQKLRQMPKFKWYIFDDFQTVLPDKSILIRQTLLPDKSISIGLKLLQKCQNSKWDIFDDF